MKSKFLTVVSALVVMCLVTDISSGARGDKMRLEDLNVLTLKSGRMTTGRRSSPVPQLKCISNCNALLPDTVQCINRGWDGTSVQWECKADFQDGYRFGDLDVVCEGYDYPDDPYILTGSCGLEYTVRGSGTGHAEKPHSYGWQNNVKPKDDNGIEFASIIFLLVVAIIVYALYVTCIARNNEDPSSARSTTNNDYPPDAPQRPNYGWNLPGMGGGRGGFGGGADDASCGPQARRGGGLGGFWTGLATGGFMGYMFGNRGGNQHYRQNYYRQPSPTTGSSFFSQSRPSFGGSSSSTSTSTGFAGTRRR